MFCVCFKKNPAVKKRNDEYKEIAHACVCVYKHTTSFVSNSITNIKIKQKKKKE